MFASSVNCNNLSTRTIKRSHASPSTSDSISNYPDLHPPSPSSSCCHSLQRASEQCRVKCLHAENCSGCAVLQCCSAGGCCMASVMCLCRVMNEEKCSQGQSWDLQSYHYQWILGDVSYHLYIQWNECISISTEFPPVSLHLAARLEISTPGKNGALCVELGS